MVYAVFNPSFSNAIQHASTGMFYCSIREGWLHVQSCSAEGALGHYIKTTSYLMDITSLNTIPAGSAVGTVVTDHGYRNDRINHL